MYNLIKLIQLRKRSTDDEFFDNFLEFEESFTLSFVNIVKMLDSSEKDHDMSVFAIYSEFSYVISHLEVIKKILKAVIDPAKLKGGFNDFTTLEQMIKKICNKMQYSEKLKNSIRGLFLVDFKNAIENKYFLIHKNGNLVIYPKDQKMKKYLNIKDLFDYSSQVIAILNAMIDWSNGQGIPVDEKTQGLDLVQDLVNQVKLLDYKLNKLA